MFLPIFLPIVFFMVILNYIPTDLYRANNHMRSKKIANKRGKNVNYIPGLKLNFITNK